MLTVVEGNNKRSWTEPSPHVHHVTYSSYLRDLTAEQVTTRALSVLTGAGIGATAGFLVGNAVAPGAGAIPGSVIGAVVGATTAVALATHYDRSLYFEFRKNLCLEAVSSLDEILTNFGMEARDICPITHCLPAFPVRLVGEPHIYEYSNLKAHIVKYGTSPMTTLPRTVENIIISLESMSRIGKLCDHVLNNPEIRKKLTKDQQKAISLLREQNLNIIKNSYEIKSAELLKELRQKTISPARFAIEAQELAGLLDPIIGDEANEYRENVTEEEANEANIL